MEISSLQINHATYAGVPKQEILLNVCSSQQRKAFNPKQSPEWSGAWRCEVREGFRGLHVSEQISWEGGSPNSVFSKFSHKEDSHLPPGPTNKRLNLWNLDYKLAKSENHIFLNLLEATQKTKGFKGRFALGARASRAQAAMRLVTGTRRPQRWCNTQACGKRRRGFCVSFVCLFVCWYCLVCVFFGGVAKLLDGPTP